MSAALARLAPLAPRNGHAVIADDPARRPGVEQPGVAQLKALQRVDMALAPEQVDLEGRFRAGRFADLSGSGDDLRLPPPPRPATDGAEIMRATGRTLERFGAQAAQPVGAEAEALVAEGRMMALLGGIDQLKLEIRSRAERERFA